jgi:transcriptional regulator with XRE-family HTH domain
MQLTSAGVRRESERRTRRRRWSLGEDLRRLRLDAGVSLTMLADVVSVDASHLARIEKGTNQPSLDLLERIAVALGADLGIRLFAGTGPRIHDRFQAPMLEALIHALHPRWTRELEVPAGPGRGFVDLVLADRVTPTVVATEAQSEIRRFEQQIRWAAEKAAALADRYEGRQVSQLLLLRSTVATRQLARTLAESFRAAYPARTADILDALTSGSAHGQAPGSCGSGSRPGRRRSCLGRREASRSGVD